MSLIIEIGKTGWRIEKCENTNDYIICVDRGISCENNIQVVSYHTTNTPSEVSVCDVVLDNENYFSQWINSFTDFVDKSRFPLHIKCRQPKNEYIGLQFMHDLLATIVEIAVDSEIPF